ncbi:hypothetical protein F0U44_04715 [Nocardioides humilatus]|uniref:Uncharacterized protein n=1 Tax=Nocardioides humilatus TaxID=2607660 RepID=A0A5B1LM83_9ACTN|nr:hypothetical protein [Nocardioides humilatus]KAA1421586.1 hypothetical protein F0U44_04715 [Nocardioides humilatus]
MANDPRATEHCRDLIPRIASALNDHLSACLADAPPTEVVARGEELTELVLQYEEALTRATGWSLPVRHLPPALATRGR